MTLLIGILCSDGAVIAADRQASHGALGMMTVGQTVTKISQIGDDILLASSGRVGISQLLEGFVAERRAEDYFARNSYSTAIGRVQQYFRPILEAGFKTATAAAPILGHAAAQNDCICSAVLAASFKEGIKVVEISAQGHGRIFDCRIGIYNDGERETDR